MSHDAIDPVTVEIIQNALNSFIREMRGTIIRTAFGPIIWEVHDFSCGLLAPDGDLVALSEDNPVHIVPTMYSVPAVLERFGDAIAAGDIFLMNDPYRLGTHMNDVAHLFPFFVEDRIAFWIVVRVHYADIGGMAAGSITPNAREVYQEGILLPPIKVYDQGRLNEAVTDVLFANVRVPEERRDDFMAVIAALRTGDKRLREILAIFGAENINRTRQIMRDRARERMEMAIAELPEGEYSYELNLDSNGLEPGWVPLRVTLTVAHLPEPRLTVDFSDSSPGVPGPMNGAPATAACAAFTAIKAFLDPLSQTNGGAFQPLRIVTKPGTIFEARPPMAMCGSLDLGYRVIELVMAALGAIRPEDAVGDHSSCAHLFMPLWDSIRERHYVFYEMPIGGTGAAFGQDGSDAVAGFERGDFPRISSVEIWEHQLPLRAEENALLPDTGGAGQFRGGLGMRRTWRLLEETSSVTDLSEPCLVPGYGAAGAYGGAPSTCLVQRGEDVIWPGGVLGTGKATGYPLHRGDLIRVERWGGGGYGDPLERDPARVFDDLNEGYISPVSAHGQYGVVIRNGTVNVAATESRRQALAAERVFARLVERDHDSIDGSTRVWEIAPELAQRLNVADGDVLECIREAKPPLRGTARINGEVEAGTIAVGPLGQKVLGGAAQAAVWIRSVRSA